MKIARALTLLAALAAPGCLLAVTRADVERCGAIEDDAQRLACFDALAPAADAPSDGVQWHVVRSVDPMTSRARILLGVEASEPVRNRAGRGVRPRLAIACRNGETELFVNVGEFLTVGKLPVMSRVDDREPLSMDWSTSTNRESAFHPNPIQAARLLADSNTYRLRLTPYGQNPKDYVFDVRGLGQHLPELADLCAWK